jgi:hypothetical protein
MQHKFSVSRHAHIVGLTLPLPFGDALCSTPFFFKSDAQALRNHSLDYGLFRALTQMKPQIMKQFWNVWWIYVQAFPGFKRVPHKTYVIFNFIFRADVPRPFSSVHVTQNSWLKCKKISFRTRYAREIDPLRLRNISFMLSLPCRVTRYFTMKWATQEIIWYHTSKNPVPK